jgi:5-methylcytosine-specific restriction endonuclease McrA
MTRISVALRNQVRQRANGRCEYCLKPDTVTRFGHQVDHVRSLKQGGNSFVTNLAYACLKCNGSKGSNIAAYDDQTDELILFLIPVSKYGTTIFRCKTL